MPYHWTTPFDHQYICVFALRRGIWGRKEGERFFKIETTRQDLTSVNARVATPLKRGERNGVEAGRVLREERKDNHKLFLTFSELENERVLRDTQTHTRARTHACTHTLLPPLVVDRYILPFLRGMKMSECSGCQEGRNDEDIYMATLIVLAANMGLLSRN